MRRTLVAVWVAIAGLYGMGSLFGPTEEKPGQNMLHPGALHYQSLPPSTPPEREPVRESKTLPSQAPASESKPTAREPETAPPATESSADAPLEIADEAVLGVKTSEAVGEGSVEVETTEPLSRKSAAGKKKQSAALRPVQKGQKHHSQAPNRTPKVAKKAKEQKAAKREKKGSQRAARAHAQRPYVIYGHRRLYAYDPYWRYPRPYVYHRPYVMPPRAWRRHHRMTYGY